MQEKLKSILLVDDDKSCNFFHERLLKKMECVESIRITKDGEEALDFLYSTLKGEHPIPSIIFLDINMPRMDGWDFLTEYGKLGEEQKAKIIVVMLSTSLNPDDREKALSYRDVKGFENKYLSEEAVLHILATYFPDYV